jgi:predicted enzyme related to lactoylglutathione lyase
MENKMNPVVHFEMPAEDTKRMSEFYTKAFNWQTRQMGPEMGSYVVVTTAESDPNDLAGRPKTPGTINGGFFQKSENNKLPTVVISVDDIQAAMKKVIDAGGTIVGGSKPGEPDNIPGVGLYIAFTDTEGNRVALLQPKGM